MPLFGPIDIQRAIDMAIILLISIDFHELAHAIVADRLGDPTPRRMGELSLNPFTHMDQVGIILLIITSIGQYGFTYGRTHVNPANLKFGPQRGNALVAAAGPLTNLVLGAVAGVVLSAYWGGQFALSQAIAQFLYYALLVNLLLFLFNLIPIPPLDGFTIVGGFLSARQMYALAPFQQWGPLIILLLLIANPEIQILSNTIYPAMYHIGNVFCPRCGLVA
ncbi:MAG: site-2 protease family protein [Chloroflexota bacterium]